MLLWVTVFYKYVPSFLLPPHGSAPHGSAPLCCANLFNFEAWQKTALDPFSTTTFVELLGCPMQISVFASYCELCSSKEVPTLEVCFVKTPVKFFNIEASWLYTEFCFRYGSRASQ